MKLQHFISYVYFIIAQFVDFVYSSGLTFLKFSNAFFLINLV